MALTRDFKATVGARVKNDPEFAKCLLDEAATLFLNGEPDIAKGILRDLVNATIGFEDLAAEIKRPSKSLHRMLAPHGNPSTENFFGIVSVLQKKTRVKLRVTAKAA